MKILVTGGNGMVGKNILEHKAVRYYDVISPSRKELNLLDYPSVDAYLKKNKPELIIHAAGKVGGIQANINSPVEFYLDNLDMGRNIVWAAKNNNVYKLINLGSSCMYPRNASNPLTEDLILTGELEPTNEGYALAKIATQRLCQYISMQYSEYKYKTIIPCNLYGRWDKFDVINSHMIPAVIHKIHEAKNNSINEVTIWGDGTARREFMYSADIANCLTHLIERFDEMPNTMNIGYGEDYTIMEFYQVIAKVIGYSGSFKLDLSKPVGMKRKLVDITKQNQMNWKPKYNLEEGIMNTYRYYLDTLV